MTETAASSSSYRIKLSSAQGGVSSVLCVDPAMTMKDLAFRAKDLLKTAAADLNLSMTGCVGGAPKRVPLQWERAAGKTLVRDVVPKMSLVVCKIGPDDDEEEAQEQEEGPAKKRVKPTPKEPVQAVEEEDDDDDDVVEIVDPVPSEKKRTQDEDPLPSKKRARVHSPEIVEID